MQHVVDKWEELRKALAASYESLEKISNKDIKQRVSDPEVADWIGKNLKRDDLANWFIREHKKDPSIFNQANQEALAHHASVSSVLNSALRLDKNHNFESGMKALKEDGDALSKKHASGHRLVEPDGEKFLDVGNGKAWYSLGKGSCTTEGAAMGHCGNAPSVVDGDNILSLRQEVTGPDGKQYHKPFVTAIENGGYLGETKGPANTKPQETEAMTALIRDKRIKGNIGGGYDPSKNFQHSDLDPKDQEELKDKHSSLFTDRAVAPKELTENKRFSKLATTHNLAVTGLNAAERGEDMSTAPIPLKSAMAKHAGLSKELASRFADNLMTYHNDNEDEADGDSADFMARFASETRNQHVIDHLSSDKFKDSSTAKHAILHSSLLKESRFDELRADKDAGTRQLAVQSSHFKSKHMKQALGDESKHVRSAAVDSSHFKAEHMKQALGDESEHVRAAAVESPHFTLEHIKQALEDSSPDVRRGAIASPHFTPEHMKQALKDSSSDVRRAAVDSSHFGPEHMEQALGDGNEHVISAAVWSPHFKPEHMEQALKDESGYVRGAAIRSPHFKPEHMEQAFENDDPIAGQAAVDSPHFGPEHMKQALGSEYPLVRRAAVESPHFGPEHMKQALSDNHPYVRRAAAESPHFGPEHMEQASRDEDTNMRAIIAAKKFPELKKALNHTQSVQSAKVAAPKADQAIDAHPDTLEQVRYGTHNIPGAQIHHEMKSTPKSKMGFAKIDGKGYVVRHGHAAQRTDVEHQMSKLLGADHMLPDQSYDHGINHPYHHGQETFDPHDHGGMSIQEHHDGKHIEDAMDDDKSSGKLKEQWKNGDLHKLWALHYISNNADMHSDNFNVSKDGVKSYDSDNAFYEVPTGHVVHRAEGKDEKHGDPATKYMPYGQSQLPAYLHPFVETKNDEGIEAKHKDQQISVKSLNDHASKIQPDLFENFGPHAAERAAKAKKALMSADPTGEMQKLWNDHSDKTGDLTWDKNQSKKKQAA